MAKDVMKFKSFNGKGQEYQIGLSIVYYLVAFESSILLSNDKKVILNQSWDEIKKQFSNGGKIVSLLKKVKDYIENDLINNSHFG